MSKSRDEFRERLTLACDEMRRERDRARLELDETRAARDRTLKDLQEVRAELADAEAAIAGLVGPLMNLHTATGVPPWAQKTIGDALKKFSAGGPSRRGNGQNQDGT